MGGGGGKGKMCKLVLLKLSKMAMTLVRIIAALMRALTDRDKQYYMEKHV